MGQAVGLNVVLYSVFCIHYIYVYIYIYIYITLIISRVGEQTPVSFTQACADSNQPWWTPDTVAWPCETAGPLWVSLMPPCCVLAEAGYIILYYIYMYIYIYICMYVCMYVYIYIYIERERERDREIER